MFSLKCDEVLLVFKEKKTNPNLNDGITASTFLKTLTLTFRQIRGIDNWKLAIISTKNFGPLTLWLPHVLFDSLDSESVLAPCTAWSVEVVLKMVYESYIY